MGAKRKSNIAIAYCNNNEWIRVRDMQNNGFKYEIQFCLDNSIILFKSNIRLLLYSRILIIWLPGFTLFYPMWCQRKSTKLDIQPAYQWFSHSHFKPSHTNVKKIVRT